MSERRDGFEVVLILVMVAAIVAHSYINWSEIRDLQRRVGQLEQQVRR